jgi:hypothetical protein
MSEPHSTKRPRASSVWLSTCFVFAHPFAHRYLQDTPEAGPSKQSRRAQNSGLISTVRVYFLARLCEAINHHTLQTTGGSSRNPQDAAPSEAVDATPPLPSSTDDDISCRLEAHESRQMEETTQGPLAVDKNYAAATMERFREACGSLEGEVTAAGLARHQLFAWLSKEIPQHPSEKVKAVSIIMIVHSVVAHDPPRVAGSSSLARYGRSPCQPAGESIHVRLGLSLFMYLLSYMVCSLSDDNHVLTRNFTSDTRSSPRVLQETISLHAGVDSQQTSLQVIVWVWVAVYLQNNSKQSAEFERYVRAWLRHFCV